MGGKGGNDAPQPMMQPTKPPVQQDLTVKALYPGPDPFATGEQQTAQNPVLQGTGDQFAPPPEQQLAPPQGFGDLSGLGDKLAESMIADGSLQINKDEEGGKTTSKKSVATTGGV